MLFYVCRSDTTVDDWEKDVEPEAESEPEAEPEGEPTADAKRESMSQAEKTNIIIIVVTVSFGIFILICTVICWYMGRCCCPGCKKTEENVN